MGQFTNPGIWYESGVRFLIANPYYAAGAVTAILAFVIILIISMRVRSGTVGVIFAIIAGVISFWAWPVIALFMLFGAIAAITTTARRVYGS